MILQINIKLRVALLFVLRKYDNNKSANLSVDMSSSTE